MGRKRTLKPILPHITKRREKTFMSLGVFELGKTEGRARGISLILFWSLRAGDTGATTMPRGERRRGGEERFGKDSKNLRRKYFAKQEPARGETARNVRKSGPQYLLLVDATAGGNDGGVRALDAQEISGGCREVDQPSYVR